MNKTRLEAFSDGVIAIIITIMVLEIKTPHNTSWSALLDQYPVFLSYALSFLFIAIYWGNHHHLLHTIQNINASIIWSNMNLLFWLSLIPFATGWMGENHFASNTLMLYAIILLLCGVAFTILQLCCQRVNRDNPRLMQAFERLKRKGIFSMVCYILAMPMAYFSTLFAGILFWIVAIMWLIPDKNIERALGK